MHLPYIISNLTNIMVPSEILFNNKSLITATLIEINNTNIKLQTSRFIQGEGSIISLAVFLKEKVSIILNLI